VLLKRKEVTSIKVLPRGTGSRAVYIIEARNRQERKDIRERFENIADVSEVRQLSEGCMMAFAVQARHDASGLSEVEQILKRNFAFSIMDRPLSDTIYGVIQDLCAETGSRLCRMPRCGICGGVEPFPTEVQMLDGEGRKVMDVYYCSRCVASQANRDDKQFLIDLLSSDRRDFSAIRKAKLVRRAARRERAKAEHLYAIAG